MNVPGTEIASAKVLRQSSLGLFMGYGSLRTQCSQSTVEEGHMVGHQAEMLAEAEQEGPWRP